MVSFKDLVKASQSDKPVTLRHEMWLEQNPNPVYSDKALAFASEALADDYNATLGVKTERLFRCSGMNGCKRQRILLRSGLEPSARPNARTANIFHTGNFMHLKWQMAGLTEGWLDKAEVGMEDPSLQLRGHTDGVLYDGSLLEIKSINSRGFDRVYKLGIKDDHKAQAASYLFMLGINRISFIYENKDTGEWFEYLYDRNDKDEEAMLQEMRDLVAYWDNDVLPDVLPACLREEGFAYNYCPFKKECLALHAQGKKAISDVTSD
jgi:hypothetical protein